MQHFIITGGLGAGKTKLVNNIATDGHWIIGSPADTMKRVLARVIAKEMGGDIGLEAVLFEEMNNRRTKEKYRGILQGFGEHFSNLDPFWWIRKVMNDVQQEMDDTRWSNDFDFVGGTVYDSVRRPQEITGIREVFPDAVRVNLEVSHARQMDYLVNHLGYTVDKAEDTLDHKSEHWLDGYQPDININAEKGDAVVWQEFQRMSRRFKP